MSELRTNKIYPKDGLPAGAVGGGIIQIVKAEITTPTNQQPGSSSNTGWTDVTPTATITPSSSSNKVLIVPSVTCITGDNNHTRILLKRGSTSIRIFNYYSSAGAYSPMTFAAWHLDSPGTTSATTYKYQIAAGANHTQFMWNYNGPDNTEPLRLAQVYLVEVSG